MHSRIVLFAAALAAPLAFGQTPQPSAAPDKPAASSLLPYVSAFADYRPYREREPLPWARANDEVGAIGGHAGTLRAAPPAAQSRPAPARPEAKP